MNDPGGVLCGRMTPNRVAFRLALHAELKGGIHEAFLRLAKLCHDRTRKFPDPK